MQAKLQMTKRQDKPNRVARHCMEAPLVKSTHIYKTNLSSIMSIRSKLIGPTIEECKIRSIRRVDIPYTVFKINPTI